MKRILSTLLTALSILTLAGCSKPGDSVTPASTTDLLVRTWDFSDVSVKTDAKLYAIPAGHAALIGDDNVLTFGKGGVLSYLDSGKTATGQWTLANDKTLTLLSADKSTSTWTINAISNTNLELNSQTVDLTKGPDINDSKVYSQEEQDVDALAVALMLPLSTQFGGTIDLNKEPVAKSVQVILKGKAK